MPVSSPTFRPIVATGASQITISETITVLGAATISLPDSTKGLVLRSRIPCELHISDSLGGSYLTVKQFCTLRLDGLEITGKILYITSSVAVTTIETLITHG